MKFRARVVIDLDMFANDKIDVSDESLVAQAASFLVAGSIPLHLNPSIVSYKLLKDDSDVPLDR